MTHQDLWSSVTYDAQIPSKALYLKKQRDLNDNWPSYVTSVQWWNRIYGKSGFMMHHRLWSTNNRARGIWYNEGPRFIMNHIYYASYSVNHQQLWYNFYLIESKEDIVAESIAHFKHHVSWSTKGHESLEPLKSQCSWILKLMSNMNYNSTSFRTHKVP